MENSIAALAGVGLRTPHILEVIERKPAIGWFEVHSENYFYHGCPAFKYLCRIREDYPISLHGVGLSLGSTEGISLSHLKRIKKLVEIIQPCMVSEHLSWNSILGHALPDLFPLPYTPESAGILADNINKVQECLQVSLLIENPSSYLEYVATQEHEADYLVNLTQKTGARLLMDVNNVYVSCQNHGWDPVEYIRAIPGQLVHEIHLAGHSAHKLPSGQTVLIDTHDRKVSDEVWELYGLAINQWGKKPTLIEWDADIPDLSVLMAEADKATLWLNPGRECLYA